MIENSMNTILYNATLFDGKSEELLDDAWVSVEDGLIREIGQGVPPSSSGESTLRLDLAGRFLMPGLIDAHAHPWLADMNPIRLMRQRSEYIASFAVRSLCNSLKRGFTTIRDAGGTDVGYAKAIEAGIIDAPRLLHTGRMLSQTGGHGDIRDGSEYDCGCSERGAHGQDRFVAIVDGADEVRKAVREQLRHGSHQVKLMGSGGVASPADPLDRVQFTDAEIRAAVEEAEAHGAYVMAHCHPAHAIARCVSLGVRSIEHGSLIDKATAELVVEKGAYVVPTLVTLYSLYKNGVSLGFPAANIAKVKAVYEGNLLRGLEIMRNAGVKMGFGTDLLGAQQMLQNEEFVLRREALPAIDILRSATSVNAKLLRMEGKIGELSVGAYADLIAVDGNPLDNISVLAKGEAAIPLVMKFGHLYENRL